MHRVIEIQHRLHHLLEVEWMITVVSHSADLAHVILHLSV